MHKRYKLSMDSGIRLHLEAADAVMDAAFAASTLPVSNCTQRAYRNGMRNIVRELRSNPLTLSLQAMRNVIDSQSGTKKKRMRCGAILFCKMRQLQGAPYDNIRMSLGESHATKEILLKGAVYTASRKVILNTFDAIKEEKKLSTHRAREYASRMTSVAGFYSRILVLNLEHDHLNAFMLANQSMSAPLMESTAWAIKKFYWWHHRRGRIPVNPANKVF